jgi:hypothetical protein
MEEEFGSSSDEEEELKGTIEKLGRGTRKTMVQGVGG